jgi:hypothetical protein
MGKSDENVPLKPDWEIIGGELEQRVEGLAQLIGSTHV